MSENPHGDIGYLLFEIRGVESFNIGAEYLRNEDEKAFIREGYLTLNDAGAFH